MNNYEENGLDSLINRFQPKLARPSNLEENSWEILVSAHYKQNSILYSILSPDVSTMFFHTVRRAQQLPSQFRKTPKKRETSVPVRSILADETYKFIRSMIFTHEIAPGDKVKIDDLALKLNVSHTPVREALARLESDGLIKKVPLKGYSATNLLTVKEFADLFRLRLLIEPWAAGQAAENIDTEKIKVLKMEMESAQAALKLDNEHLIQAVSEHDARFHLLIAELSGNHFVKDAFEGTHCHLHLFRLYIASKKHLIDFKNKPDFIIDLFAEYYQSSSGQLAMKQHSEIANAIIKRDVNMATKKMHQHIESSLQRFTKTVDKVNREDA